MHHPHRLAQVTARTLGVAAAALLLLPALPAAPARADAVVTPASGGANIPADRALRGGDAPGASTLGPITLQELTPGDIGDGNSRATGPSAIGSVTTSTTAMRPEASARSSAGRMSWGRSTRSA
mgnify:CR=1 FL=1